MEIYLEKYVANPQLFAEGKVLLCCQAVNVTKYVICHAKTAWV